MAFLPAPSFPLARHCFHLFSILFLIIFEVTKSELSELAGLPQVAETTLSFSNVHFTDKETEVQYHGRVGVPMCWLVRKPLLRTLSSFPGSHPPLWIKWPFVWIPTPFCSFPNLVLCYFNTICESVFPLGCDQGKATKNMILQALHLSFMLHFMHFLIYF